MSDVTPIPGEGLERHLRTLLRDYVFKDILGWPSGKLISGEVYDLYAYDLLGYEAVYIETKTPKFKALKESDSGEFKKKLKRLGTAEYGAITNGHVFVTYCCRLIEGKVITEQIVSLDLDKALKEHSSGELSHETLAKVNKAFSPFAVTEYLRTDKRPYQQDFGRISPTRDDPRSIGDLSTSLRKAVDELTPPFLHMIDWLYKTKTTIGRGDSRGFAIDEPLDDWSALSGKVPPTLMMKELEETVGELLGLHDREQLNEAVTKRVTTELRKKIGVPLEESDMMHLVTEAIVAPQKIDECLNEKLYDVIRQGYAEILARQTAYVVLSRILLYRVSEDKDLVVRRLSGSDLDRFIEDGQVGELQTGEATIAFRRLIDETDELMRRVFYSHLYAHGLFDWWRIPSNVRRLWSEDRSVSFRRLERAVDIALEKVLAILNRYALQDVERDIWKDVYQEYLPAMERRTLGGFYTPDEVVCLILDLVGYEHDAFGLCEKDLLDPACGSGTFLVEATRRLRRHLENPALPCHSTITKLEDMHERSWRILQELIDHIYGIDIHPFACFLSEMNFLFMTVDLLLSAKHTNPQRLIEELNIGSDDSIRPLGEKLQLSLSHFSDTNSRADVTVKDRDRANRIKRKKFHFVVGNPPWSGVLRGNLSPLFDEATKKIYKSYMSSTDKYDIYVLFIERGIQWLRNKGILGFITQNRYFRRKYGRGVREFTKMHCEAEYVMDLGNVGRAIFGRSNYPAISVYRRVSE